MTLRWFGALCASSLALAPCAAGAQTAAQIAARRDLLASAEQASQAGDHAHALDLAQHAGQIQMTPSLRMFIASEEAALGRIAAALGDADSCLHEAERDATMRNRDAVMARCRDISNQMRPRSAHVTVHVPSPLPAGFHVTVGGDTLDPVLYGVPAVVAAGTVTIDAEANGRPTLHQTVDVAPGANSDITIVFGPETAPTSGGTTQPAQETHAASTASAAPTHAESHPPPEPSTAHTAPPPATATHATTAPAATGGGMSPVAVAGLAAAGVGLIAAGIGAYLYFVDTANTYNHCVANGCFMNQYAGAPGEELASLVMLYGGGVLLVGGVVAFVLFRNSGEHEQQQHTGVSTVWLDPRGGIGIGGRF